MKLIPLFKRIKLNKSQEKEYQLTLENEIKQYIWIIFVLLIFFQIYNMLYAGFYTGFRFHTFSSKIYMIMYGIMLLVCLFSLAMIYRKNNKLGRIVFYQNFFVYFLLCWSLAVTVYDNRVSNNINVYVISLLSISILTYLPPKLFVPLYVFGNIGLISAIALIFPNKYVDHYSSYINSVSITIMALFISYYHYQSTRQMFLNNYLIQEKNKTIIENSARLDFVAHHDPLTKLLNRRYLNKYLDTLYQKNAYLPIKTGVLMIDIDDFKKYNDYFGHVKGDQCLERVANALTLALTEGILIRYGGEEFIYIVENTTLEKLQEIGNELCKTIEHLALKVPPMAKYSYLTISCGGSYGIVKDEEVWLQVLNQADQALYQAKSSGKDRCICK